MSDSRKVHVTFNLVMDVHLEVERWMERVHVPRKIASRIENASMSAAISLSSAVSMRRDFHLRSARERLIVTLELLEQLLLERFLSPYQLVWIKRQLGVVFTEIDHWDPTHLVPMMAPRPRGRRVPMLN